MSKRISRWMPWYEFNRMGAEARELSDRSHGLLVLIGLLVAGTVAASTALPRLTLPISVSGGLVIVTVIMLVTGQWRALRDGIRAAGGFPPMLELTRVAWQMCLDDVRHIGGRRHDDQRTAIPRDDP